MVNLLFVAPVVMSFLVTLFVVPYWIRRARKAELVGRDMHKLDKRHVAEIGGIPVLIGFLAGAFAYIGIRSFYYGVPTDNYEIFALLNTVLLAAVIGLIDDILGWKIGLRQWQKPVLTLFAALPMVVVNAGSSIVGLPYLGTTELSFLYPFLIVPLGIAGAANGFNMIGGYNGLEAGMGGIILGALGLIAFLSGEGWLAVLSLSMVAAIAAFLLYNKYPARVFPGNTFTYLVGALIACIAITGNMEKLALLLFIPYFFEFLLKTRGLMQKESFARLLPDGNLATPYDKWYGLEHVAIAFVQRVRGHVTEQHVVSLLVGLEALLGILAILVFHFRIGVF